MSKQNQSSRRRFYNRLAPQIYVAAAAPLTSMAAKEKAEERTLFYEKKISAGDKIRLAVIGYGVQGSFRPRHRIKNTRGGIGWYL